MQVVRVSGTIKKSEQEAVRRARSIIVHARKAGGISRSIVSGPPASVPDSHVGDLSANPDHISLGIEYSGGEEAEMTDDEE